MMGLLIVSSYFLMMIQLQPHLPWLPWCVLVFIGFRCAAAIGGVTDMSNRRIMTKYEDVIRAMDNPKQSRNSIITEESLAALERIWEEEIFGQDHVIKPLIAKIRANAEIPDRERPIISAAFFGPPGVGKTTLAELISKAILGNLKLFIRIDSSQNQDHGTGNFFGSPKGFEGSRAYGSVTGTMRENGQCAVLVDEPDRVNGDSKRWNQAWMPFLEGRVTEVSTQQEFSTRNSLIFFASNYEHEKLGLIAEKYRLLQDQMTPAELAAAMRKEAMNILKDEVFPRALLDRFDSILILAPLNKEATVDILLKEIDVLTRKYDMEVEFIEPELLTAAIRVGEAGDSTGARDFKRWVTDNVNPALISAKRQNAQKLKLILGTDGKVYATITQSRDELPASGRAKAKQ